MSSSLYACRPGCLTVETTWPLTRPSSTTPPGAGWVGAEVDVTHLRPAGCCRCGITMRPRDYRFCHRPPVAPVVRWAAPRPEGTHDSRRGRRVPCHRRGRPDLGRDE